MPFHPRPLPLLLLTATVLLGSVAVSPRAHAEAATAESPQDRAILDQLQREHGHLDAHDVRLVHPSTFPQVTLVGFFYHDAGYRLKHVFVQGKAVPVKQSSAAILATRDWPHLDGQHREGVARDYMHDIRWGLGDSGSLVKQAVKDHPEITTGLHVRTTATGETVASFWEQGPSGMVPVATYHQIETTFSAQGKVTSKTVKQVEIPYH